MAALATVTAVRAGVALGAVAAGAGGDTFTNTGKELLYIKDAAGGGLTLTIVTTQTSDGLAVADRTVAVANNAEIIVGPFPTGIYGETVSLTYSDVTNVTVAVINPG